MLRSVNFETAFQLVYKSIQSDTSFNNQLHCRFRVFQINFNLFGSFQDVEFNLKIDGVAFGKLYTIEGL